MAKARTYEITAGTIGLPIKFGLKEPNGTLIDWDARIDSANLIYSTDDGATQVTLPLLKYIDTVNEIPVFNAIHEWLAGETDLAGTYLAQVEINFVGGGDATIPVFDASEETDDACLRDHGVLRIIFRDSVLSL